MELISKNFVPVALNTDRLPDTSEARFYRKLMKEWPQGLWVVTPEGKVLGFAYHRPQSGKTGEQNQKLWIEETRTMLKDALTATGELPPRAGRKIPTFPDRGVGFNTAGGVRLSVTVLPLRNGKQDGPPAVDSVLWSAKQVAALLPQDGKAEWALPEAMARECCTALSIQTDKIYVPLQEDVGTATITAKLLRRDERIAVVELTATWKAEWDREDDPKFPLSATANAKGIVELDLKGKTLKTLLLVGSGTNTFNGAKRAFANVIEWTAAKQE